MIIKIKIPGFGERFCSNNVEYKLYDGGDFYIFYKKGTYIFHNEYGPAIECKGGSYDYWINGKQHRLSSCSEYSATYRKYKSYFVIGFHLGDTKEDFIKNLANTLIPKEYENEQEN